jgi:hypothetical protein
MSGKVSKFSAKKLVSTYHQFLVPSSYGLKLHIYCSVCFEQQGTLFTSQMGAIIRAWWPLLQEYQHPHPLFGPLPMVREVLWVTPFQAFSHAYDIQYGVQLFFSFLTSKIGQYRVERLFNFNHSTQYIGGRSRVVILLCDDFQKHASCADWLDQIAFTNPNKKFKKIYFIQNKLCKS